MAKRKQRLTFRRAAEIFTPKRETGMHIDNDGSRYTLTSDDGLVVGTFETYEDVLEHARGLDPQPGPRCLAPEPDEETVDA